MLKDEKLFLWTGSFGLAEGNLMFITRLPKR